MQSHTSGILARDFDRNGEVTGCLSLVAKLGSVTSPTPATLAAVTIVPEAVQCMQLLATYAPRFSRPRSSHSKYGV